MPLLALLVDVITVGCYFFQVNHGSSALYLVGIVVQTILTIILLIILVGYHGKKYSRIKPIGYSYFSIRYAVIVLSFIINGIVLFLYVLNYLGINHVIFAAI